MAKFKPSGLTDEEKAANVAAGLTPTGKVRTKRGPRKPSLNRKGVNKVPDLPEGDYRNLGFNFTPVRKNAFLDVIREKGSTSIACRVVRVRPNTVSDHRKKDHAFRDAMDEAFRQHAARLVEEAYRRGVEGVQRPVYGTQGPGQGSGVVGWMTEYSDRLLLELLRKYDPDFRPAAAKVEANNTAVAAAPEGGLGVDKLLPESRADLKRILERELGRRKDNDNGVVPASD